MPHVVPFDDARALLVVSLVGCVGNDDDADVVHAERPAFVKIGGEAPYRLISVGFDSTTYEEVFGDRDARPGVVDLGPSTTGQRDVKLHVDRAAPGSGAR